MLGRLLLLLAASTATCAAADPLAKLLDDLVVSGQIVGAQGLVGERDRILTEIWAGTVSPGSERNVGRDTQFCIGSTSKPLASAAVLSLVAEGKLSLDEGINRWLPAFSWGPTLRQLLSHHGGIYSQRDGLSESQRRWIRDFRISLRQAVDGIAGEPTIAAPGERFAYSGAGYCIVGQVAATAAGREFEEVLRERVTGPLEMTRTTYFPEVGDSNVAAGSSPDTPHLLGRDLKLPLIGGSVYSTARDLSRFAQMMIGQGELDGERVLPRELWRQMITRTGFSETAYALGWGLRGESRIRHGGALATSRAILEIDLSSGRYAIVLYSLTEVSDEVRQRINRAAAAAL